MDINIIETAAGCLQYFYEKGHQGGSLHHIVCSTMCEEDKTLDEDEVRMIVEEMMADAEKRWAGRRP